MRGVQARILALGTGWTCPGTGWSRHRPVTALYGLNSLHTLFIPDTGIRRFLQLEFSVCASRHCKCPLILYSHILWTWKLNFDRFNMDCSEVLVGKAVPAHVHKLRHTGCILPCQISSLYCVITFLPYKIIGIIVNRDTKFSLKEIRKKNNRWTIWNARWMHPRANCVHTMIK